MKKYYYTYKITNTINNKYYFGKGSCNCDPEKHSYMGSSTSLNGTSTKRGAYEKYGKCNFKKEVIDVFSTEVEAYEDEARLCPIEEANNPMCYNQKCGGTGGSSPSDITRSKISNKLTGLYKGLSYEERFGVDKANKIKEKQSIIQSRSMDEKYGVDKAHDIKNKISNTLMGVYKGISYDERFGKEKSKTIKEKISEKLTGKNVGTYESRFGKDKAKNIIDKQVKANTGKKRSEETKEKMRKPKSKEHASNISKGRKGIIFSESHCENISKSHTGIKQSILTCPHCGKSGGNSMKMFHFDKCLSNPNLTNEEVDSIKIERSLSRKGKKQQIVTCPHCGEVGSKGNMTRWHFNNCKLLNK